MKKKSKKSQIVVGCLVIASVIGLSGIASAIGICIRYIHKVQQQRQIEAEALNKEVITKSQQYQAQGLCLELARTDQIKLSDFDVLKVPLSSHISTLVLVGNDKYTKAYLLTSEQGQWVGSELLAKYKITEENGKRILSFEDSILDAQNDSYILVVITPKKVAKNLEILPFNNQDLGQINSLSTYQTKFRNGYIISQFESLKIIKNKTQPIKVELESLFDENLYMGQLLIPPNFDLQNKLLSPIIQPISQCELNQLMEDNYATTF